MDSQKAKIAISAALKSFWLLLSGIGVGWLIGLSTSPVIYIVITSLIAFIVSVTSALAGVKLDQDKSESPDQVKQKHRLQLRVDPLPMTLMIIGLAFGASLGVYARTNEWLGPRPDGFAERWKDTELSKKEISRHLFDQLYPARTDRATSESSSSPPGAGPSESSAISLDKPAEKKESQTEQQQTQSSSNGDLAQRNLSPVLFSATFDECASLRTATDEDLRNQLTHLTGSSAEAEKIRQEARSCPNVECLKTIVRRICRKPRSE